MPLVYPYTIATGFIPTSVLGRSGPFTPATGVRYVAMQNQATGQVSILKSTDLGETWAIQDNGSAPSYDESVSAFGLIVSVLDGTDIWVLIDHAGLAGAPNLEVTAYRFDTTTDTWARTDDTGGAYVSDSSFGSGNWHASGIRVHDGEVQVFADQRNAATDDELHPLLMTCPVGGSSWTSTYFPDMDGTNDLWVSGVGATAEYNGFFFVICQVNRIIFDLSHSCFSAAAYDGFDGISDIRFFYVSPTGTLSGYLDGCLAMATSGVIPTSGETNGLTVLQEVDGFLWHVYFTQKFPSEDYFIRILGPDEDEPETYWTTPYEIAIPTGQVPLSLYMARIGPNPIMLFITQEGSDPPVAWFTAFDGTDWSAPVVASDFFPDIGTSGVISFMYTESGSVGLIQLDQYWEYKFASADINPDSAMSEEVVPTPTIVLGSLPPTGQSGWYTF